MKSFRYERCSKCNHDETNCLVRCPQHMPLKKLIQTGSHCVRMRNKEHRTVKASITVCRSRGSLVPPLPLVTYLPLEQQIYFRVTGFEQKHPHFFSRRLQLFCCYLSLAEYLYLPLCPGTKTHCYSTMRVTTWKISISIGNEEFKKQRRLRTTSKSCNYIG